jgi:hypothetical protein
VLFRTVFVAQAVAGALLAASAPPTARASNMQVELTATLYVDKPSIQQLLGSDLGGYYVIVEVRLAPRNNEKLKVMRDDFGLRTDRDGERSKPWAASQVAGKGALVVSKTYEGGGVAAENGGPSIFGGMGAGGIGNAGSSVSNTSKMDVRAKNKDSSLLDLLKEKILQEKETEEPISGLLIFPMEPKQKAKDLELTYAGPGSKQTLRFR